MWSGFKSPLSAPGQAFSFTLFKVKPGGDGRVRTDDPYNAIVVLFQLSYVPLPVPEL